MRLTRIGLLVGVFVSVFAVSEEPFEALLARDEGSQCGVRIRSSFAGDNSADRVDAFEFCLGAYLRTRTANPPGREELGADFLTQVFRELGIPTLRMATTAEKGKPRRTSLIATLTSSNSANGPLKSEGFAWGRSSAREGSDPVLPSILLLNHIDVIGVKSSQWARKELPWSGTVWEYRGKKDVWGRGALDMKGIAMLQVFSMAALKAKSTRIEKAIHFAAVADEEENAVGALQVIREIRKGGDLEALLGLEVVLGEGGFSVEDALGAGTLVHLIGTEEKGGAWLRLKHLSGIGMLRELIELGILPHAGKHYTWWASSWGCQLEEVHQETTKINVKPSSIALTLRCVSQPKLAALKAAFEDPEEGTVDGSVRLSETTAQQDGDRVQIQIGTASTSHTAAAASFSALDVLAIGLQRLALIEVPYATRPEIFRYYQTQATRSFIKTTGEVHNLKYLPRIPDLPSWLSWFSSVEQLVLGEIGSVLATESLFRTSCSWNGFEVNAKEATALLDCRLSHPRAMGLKAGKKEGTQFAKKIENLLEDKQLKIEVMNEWNYTQSPIRHPAVRAMFGELRTRWPNASPTPWLFPAGSDLRMFREPHNVGGQLAPVPSYGFFPCPIPVSYIQTVHGPDERYPVAQIGSSIDVYGGVVGRLVH